MTMVQDDVLRITAEMSVGADAVQNVFHFQYLSEENVTDAVALLDAALIMEDLYNEILADLSTSLDFDQVRCQNITQDVLYGSGPWPTIVAGLLVAELLPRPVAALITYATSVPLTRGGTYFGGFTEDDNTTGAVISTGSLTALAALAANVLAGKNISGRLYNLIVLNREFGTVIPVVSTIVHAVWRTQRRRRQGVGI